MPYSPEYFDLQLRFAGLVAERLGLRLASAVTDYTAVQVSMDLGATPELRSRNWDRYCDGLASAEDATTWTYAFFLKHQPEFPGLQATHFSDRPLFGCFYYNIRNGCTVRPGFIKREGQTLSPLISSSWPERIAELGTMFRHIKERECRVITVEGNSWLYNLEAYRRLFPEEYIEDMVLNEDPDLQYLMIWGQFFDHSWRVREKPAKTLLSAAGELSHAEQVRACFPLQAYRPRSEVEVFYDFYGLYSARETP